MLHLKDYKLHNLIILFLLIIPSIAISAEKKESPPFNMKVRVLKREKTHIKTAALICALLETKATKSEIQQAWHSQLKPPISNNDKYLVKSIMKGMCPEIYE